MEFFTGAGAGDVEEAFFFGTIAAGAEGAQPGVEFVGVLSFAPDGSKDDGGDFVGR